MATTVKPADLRSGHRIVHTVPNMEGVLTVHGEPWVDLDDEEPRYSRVYVNVEASDRSPVWNSEDLPAGTGAERFLFITPTRYSLCFHADTNVEVE